MPKLIHPLHGVRTTYVKWNQRSESKHKMLIDIPVGIDGPSWGCCLFSAAAAVPTINVATHFRFKPLAILSVYLEFPFSGFSPNK